MDHPQIRRPSLSSLDLHDYRKLFAILEDVADSRDAEFFDALRDALARHLGWTDSVIVDIPNVVAPFPPCPVALDHMHTNRPTAFLEEYVDRWSLRNPFKTAGAARLLTRDGSITLAGLRPYSTDDEWDFIDTYLRRHRVADVLNGRIDATPEGSALICRYAADESEVDERERVLMNSLTRHLSSWLRDYFGRSRKTSDRAALTDREAQIAHLVAQGMTNGQIARQLDIRLDTVKKHLMHAMAKTHSDNRTQLALFVLGRDKAL